MQSPKTPECCDCDGNLENGPNLYVKDESGACLGHSPEWSMDRTRVYSAATCRHPLPIDPRRESLTSKLKTPASSSHQSGRPSRRRLAEKICASRRRSSCSAVHPVPEKARRRGSSPRRVASPVHRSLSATC